MRYLVTGGAGFIGSHVSDALIGRGHEVEALDDLSTGSVENVASLLGHPRFSFVEGTVRDLMTVREAVRRADAVVHLAASVGVRRILERPLESLINNVHGTELVLDACAELERKALVASTSEIYGKNKAGPLSEDADRILGSASRPRWWYSISKAVDEILAFAYWRERGTPTIVVRLFNTAGPRQTGTYGMVIPRFVRQALNGDDVTVYGDGTQRRCFCHVDDTVRALLALLDHPLSVGEVFNIGSRQETTVNELARRVVDITGSSSRIVHVPYEEAYGEGFEDMQRRIPDTTKIESLTGWRPQRTLDSVITDVIDGERGFGGSRVVEAG
jgi:UDP-glucose 4-epimerase